MKNIFRSFLLALLLLVASASYATEITVASFTIPNYTGGGSTAKIRLYSPSNWTDSTGVPHIAGTFGSSTGFFQEISCSVSGTTITVPSFTTPSTVDAIDSPQVKITAVLFDYRGVKREVLFSNWFIPVETPTTWARLVALNAARPKTMPDTYPTTAQVSALISSAVGTMNDASDMVKGRTALSTAPASAASPIAVGDNDRRVGATWNVKGFGAICDFNRITKTGTDDTAAILATISAMETAGGSNLLIPGNCMVRKTTAGTILTLTKGVELAGIGAHRSGLFFSTDTAASVKMIVYKPAAFGDNEGFYIHDLTLGTAGNEVVSGGGHWTCNPCSGGDLLTFDSTALPSNSYYIRRATVERVMFLPTTLTEGLYYSVMGVGTNPNGTPAKSRFLGNTFYNGVKLDTLGDSVTFAYNQWINQNGLDVTQVAGAANLIIGPENNLTSHKGVRVGRALSPLVFGNYFELYEVGSTGTANNSIVTFENTTNGQFHNNTVTSLNGVSLDGIYLGVVDNFHFTGNYFNIPLASLKYGLAISATATGIVPGRNYPAPSGNPIFNPASSFLAQVQPYSYNLMVMPSAGQGITGHIAQIGDGRFVGESTRAVTLTLDDRGTGGNAYAQVRGEHSGTAGGVINFVGPSFSDATRQNNLELYNVASAGSITFHTNNQSAPRAAINAAGVFNSFKGADVVSATTITPTGNGFHVTGATTITAISPTGLAPGTTLKLIFDSTAQMTDGGTLKLAGDFTGGAGRTLVLFFDGANFYELSRSAN